MSGGGGGPIIIGDKSLIDQLIANSSKVAVFRLERMLDIIKAYRHNENQVTRDDQVFLLICGIDVVQNV